MTVHLQRQLESLKHMVRELGARVQGAFADSIRSLRERNATLARRIIRQDSEINRMEVDIEEECLHTLALYQPVAFDLRYVVAVLKINSDLERIADLAVNICEQVAFLAEEPEIDSVPYDLEGMIQRVDRMVIQSLESMVNVDPELADHVRDADDEVDQIHRAMYQKIEDAIQTRPDQTSQMILMLNLSRNLERIADLAVNIAEDVMYLSRGDIARHRPHTTAS